MKGHTATEKILALRGGVKEVFGMCVCIGECSD